MPGFLSFLGPALTTATQGVAAYDQGKRLAADDARAQAMQAAQQKRQETELALKQAIADRQAKSQAIQDQLRQIGVQQAEYTLQHPKPIGYQPQTQEEAIQFAGKRAAAVSANTPHNIDPNSPAGVAAKNAVQSQKPAPTPRPNETQMRASLVYPRAAQAAATLDKFYTSGAPAKTVASQIPLVGNYLLSDEEQALNQAAETVASAILRLESGAAITQNEVKSYAKQFLPQPGDSKEVLDQKRATLHTQLDRMKAVASAAMGNSAPADVTETHKQTITATEAEQLRAAGVSEATIQDRYIIE